MKITILLALLSFASTSEKCNCDAAKGEFCNHDHGDGVGTCESCHPSGQTTEEMCLSVGFHTKLGTQQCIKTCVKSEQQKLKPCNCDATKGEFCNHDDGEGFGFCETCHPSGQTTEEMCLSVGFHSQLGTQQCIKTCVKKQPVIGNLSEYRLALLSAPLSATQASVKTCTTNKICTDDINYKTGCCAEWKVLGMSTAPKWGDFANIWGGEVNIKVGASFKACSGKAYLDAHFKANADGKTNNYDDLQMFLDNVPNVRTNLKLKATDNVDEWITAWKGEAKTQKDFKIQVLCLPGSGIGPNGAKAATALAASAAAVASAMMALF